MEMQHMPGSQLCSGHDGVEEWDNPAASWKCKNDHRGLSCSGAGGEILTTRSAKGAISAQLPRESTANLLGICQQVPQISTSFLAEEDVLLWNGTGHQQVSAANGGQ